MVIIVIVVDPNGQAQIMTEGGDLETCEAALRTFANQLEQQNRTKKSGLIVPSTAVPKEVLPKAAGGSL